MPKLMRVTIWEEIDSLRARVEALETLLASSLARAITAESPELEITDVGGLTAVEKK
jgi:hypothetical protein